MKRRTRLAGAVTAAMTVAALIPLSASPAAAVSEPEIVAEGLNNPYKMSFGADGTLYVAEAGTGAEGVEDPDCVEFPEGPDGPATEMCVGATGSVTAVDVAGDGGQERVVTGLASLAPGDSGGNGAIGPVDVAVVGTTAYVVLGLGGAPEDREAIGGLATQLGTVQQVPLVVDGADPTTLADLAQFEADEDPDAEQPGSEGVDSNPFAIEVDPGGGFWAVDAGGNDVLSIDLLGNIAVEAVLPFEMTAAPPFLGLPPGTEIPFQPVPTSITNGEAGLLVTELTGFPFPPGESDVYDLSSGELEIVESGFTNVVDAAQAPDGTVYVLEFSAEGLLNVPDGSAPTSRLTQIRTDGTRKVLLQDELFLSNGVAVDDEGMVYVSNGSQLAGGGTVIKVDPTVPRDPATASACQPEDVPGSGFTDVGGNTHREAIDCLAWWGVVEGRTATTFDPRSPVKRDQMASIVARLLEEAGVELPAGAPDAFGDDDDSVHEDNINALAALGVVEGRSAGVFAPSQHVTRAQVASMLARAWEEAAGEALAAGPDAFGDDDDSVHEDNINAVAAAGWVNGKSAGVFDPQGNATRDQVTSMVARMLSDLVDEGLATLPA